jgi:urease accessory protein UreE
VFFRSVPTADTVFRLDRLPAALVEAPREIITLGWESRAQARARRRTDSGVEFWTALPADTILRDGDCLTVGEPPLVIVVRELAEPVLVARAADPDQLAMWAYHIGNSHQPLMIAGGALVCPEVPDTVQVMQYHHIRFTREQRPFTPLLHSPGHAT